jgi:ankyrin repeat protein
MSTRKQGLFSDYDELAFKIIKILLHSGANVNAKSKDGRSPFSLAFETGNIKLLSLLVEKVDLNEDPTLLFAIKDENVVNE